MSFLTIEPGDVQPGDTIRIATKRRDVTVTVTEEGVVGFITTQCGLAAVTADGTYIGRLDRFPAPDSVVYLLDRPKPVGALASLAPGIVRDHDGREWIFDGDTAARPHALGLELVGRGDLSKQFEPWAQVATLNKDEPATPSAPGPVKYGVRDHEGQRAWVSRDSIGNLRIGVEEESAYLTKENAADLIQHLTELAGGA